MGHIDSIKRRIRNMITSLTNMKTNMKTNTTTKVTIVSRKPEWKALCDECSSAAKKTGWTRKDSRELIKAIREKNNF